MEFNRFDQKYTQFSSNTAAKSKMAAIVPMIYIITTSKVPLKSNKALRALFKIAAISTKI